ncbi:MAG: hypothetical protein WAN65_11875 [Candidatus Sulfotelmatobacter sp.]
MRLGLRIERAAHRIVHALRRFLIAKFLIVLGHSADHMTKKPRRKNLKSAGKCIFCLGGAVPGNPMTREHLWSDWMDKAGLLPKGGEYFQFRQVFKQDRRNTVSMFRRTRQGSANTVKIKVVCKKCNGDWMSRLETDVQRCLTPLIKGAPEVLDYQMRLTLSQWIAMKVLVAEHNSFVDHPADPIYDQSARNAFMESCAIPAGFRIWIAYQNGAKWITGFHRHATGLGYTETLPPPLPPPTRTKNIQVVTWGIGKLLIFLDAVSDPDVYGRFELSNIGPLHGLWPLSAANIIWPTQFLVGDAYIDDLTGALGRYINSPSVIRQF